METIDDKEVIKVVISSGTEKPYYLRKKGRIPEGCYIRVGSSKERMTERMIDDIIGSGVLRILDAYDKSCFKFMDHFLKIMNVLKELGIVVREGSTKKGNWKILK